MTHTTLTDALITIVVAAIVAGLVIAANEAAPTNTDAKRWGRVVILLAAAVLFAVRFLR